MKTSLLLAIIASTALTASAFAQSGDTAATGTAGSTTSGTVSGTSSGSTGTTDTTGSSSSTAGSTGTPSTTSPGTQTPNPNIYGGSSGQQPGSGYGGQGWGMMQAFNGTMTCVSPAPGPMGGPGSFACFPAQGEGQGNMMGPGMMGSGMMGMGNMMGWRGWHPHMGWQGWNQGGYGYDQGYGAPGWAYPDRSQYDRGQGYSGSYRSNDYDRNRGYEGQSQYDNDWRSSGGGYGYDNRSQQDDDSSRSYGGSNQ